MIVVAVAFGRSREKENGKTLRESASSNEQRVSRDSTQSRGVRVGRGRRGGHSRPMVFDRPPASRMHDQEARARASIAFKEPLELERPWWSRVYPP